MKLARFCPAAFPDDPAEIGENGENPGLGGEGNASPHIGGIFKASGHYAGGLRRGGARNRADRISHTLTEAQCFALIDAAERALEVGRPFNRFVTILWERGGIASGENAGTTGRFVKLASDWARRRGYRLPWAWVQEHGPVNGAHVHMLLHVPPDLDPLFRPMPLRWVKHLLPGRYVPSVLQCQKIAGGRYYSATPDLYRMNLERKLEYMLKASSGEIAARFTGRWLPRGCIVQGKRAGVWQRAIPGTDNMA